MNAPVGSTPESSGWWAGFEVTLQPMLSRQGCPLGNTLLCAGPSYMVEGEKLVLVVTTLLWLGT